MIHTRSHMQVLQIHEDLFWLSWLAYNILQHLTPSYCELPIICTHRPAFKCQATQVASSWVAGPLCLAAQREGGEVLVALHGLLRQHSTRGEMGIDETLTSIWLKKYSETKTYSSDFFGNQKYSLETKDYSETKFKRTSSETKDYSETKTST